MLADDATRGGPIHGARTAAPQAAARARAQWGMLADAEKVDLRRRTLHWLQEQQNPDSRHAVRMALPLDGFHDFLRAVFEVVGGDHVHV